MIKLCYFYLLFAIASNDHLHEEYLPIFGEPIQNVSTTLGKDATFYCKIHNIGRYKAEWSKIDESGNHWSIGTLGSRVSLMYVDETTWPLRIRHVRSEDRGTYMCKVNTEPVTMQVAYLYVAIPPRILDEETSGNVRIEEGSPTALICKGAGSPHPSIGWRREGNAEITYFSKYHGLRKVRYYVGETLQLHQVSREDAGIYYCLAVNGVPPIPSKRIILEVFFRPEMRVIHYKIEANLEDDVSLICKVESYPKPESSWLKSGEKISSNSDKYIITDEIIQVKGSFFITMKLTVKNFTKDDAANYICASTNSLGYSEATIKVFGSHFGYFDEEELTYFGGRETNCILDLKRNTYINPCCRRTKIGIPYHGKIIYLHQKREKVFEPSPCSSIINSFRPEMKVPHYRIDSAIGEEATLVCTVEAYPKPMNTWLRAGKTKLSKNSKYDVLEVVRRINFSYVIKMRLAIKNFTENDSTIYTCVSRNMLGYSESSIKINARKSTDNAEGDAALEKPSKKEYGCLLDFNMNNYLYPCCRRNPYPGGSNVGVSHHIIHAPIGSNVSIPCSVLYNPTNKNKWTKFPGNKIITSNVKFNLSHENLVKSRFYNKMDMVLTVQNISKSEAGSYACSTRSSLEYKEVIVQIKVTNETIASVQNGEQKTNTVSTNVDQREIFFTPDFEKGKPQIQTPCYKVEHKFGEDIVLMCSVKSYPRPVNVWRKLQPIWLSREEDDTLKTNKKYEVNEEHTGYFKITMRLTIRSFSKHDETSYTCSSRNPYGATEATIKVFGVPHQTPSSVTTEPSESDVIAPDVEQPDVDPSEYDLPKTTDLPNGTDIVSTDATTSTSQEDKVKKSLTGNVTRLTTEASTTVGSKDAVTDGVEFMYSYEDMTENIETDILTINDLGKNKNDTLFVTTIEPGINLQTSSFEPVTTNGQGEELQTNITEKTVYFSANITKLP